MKVRNGFVSNSSSSSFCVFGQSFEFSELLELSRNAKLFNDEQLEEFESDYNLYELADKVGTKLGFNQDCDEEEAYFGRDWSSIEDDETGLQFKQSVIDKFNEVFGEGKVIPTAIDTVIY